MSHFTFLQGEWPDVFDAAELVSVRATAVAA